MSAFSESEFEFEGEVAVFAWTDEPGATGNTAAKSGLGDQPTGIGLGGKRDVVPASDRPPSGDAVGGEERGETGRGGKRLGGGGTRCRGGVRESCGEAEAEPTTRGSRGRGAQETFGNNGQARAEAGDGSAWCHGRRGGERGCDSGESLGWREAQGVDVQNLSCERSKARSKSWPLNTYRFRARTVTKATMTPAREVLKVL